MLPGIPIWTAHCNPFTRPTLFSRHNKSTRFSEDAHVHVESFGGYLPSNLCHPSDSPRLSVRKLSGRSRGTQKNKRNPGRWPGGEKSSIPVSKTAERQRQRGNEGGDDLRGGCVGGRGRLLQRKEVGGCPAPRGGAPHLKDLYMKPYLVRARCFCTAYNAAGVESGVKSSTFRCGHLPGAGSRRRLARSRLLVVLAAATKTDASDLRDEVRLCLILRPS